MEPRSQQHRGRLLLARAYSKNPNWLRRAEEMLQELMREDATNADVHYELGLVYKTGGFAARAQGMFRRALELRPGHKEAAAELGITDGRARGRRRAPEAAVQAGQGFLSSRRAARLLLLLLAAVLAALALGAPRFTWANEGVVIDHPRTQPAAALAAALSLGAAAFARAPPLLDGGGRPRGAGARGARRPAARLSPRRGRGGRSNRDRSPASWSSAGATSMPSSLAMAASPCAPAPARHS